MIRFLCFAFLFCSFLSAQAPFHGKIESNTSWSGTIVLDGDILVEKEAVLFIAPGTQVQILPNTDRGNLGSDREKTEIIIMGKIIAKGSAQAPIVFTASSPTPAPADWQGITLKNRGEVSQFSYCTVEYAYEALSCYGSSPEIEHSTFQHNYYAGVSTELKSAARLLSCVLRDNQFAGLICELGARPVVEQCQIFNNVNGVIVFDRSRPDLGQRYAREGESRGENQIYGNQEANILNRSDASIFAQNNQWKTNSREEIRKTIVDRRNNPSYGDVLFQPHQRNTRGAGRAPQPVANGGEGPSDPLLTPQVSRPSGEGQPLSAPQQTAPPQPNPAEWRVDNYRTSLDEVEADRVKNEAGIPEPPVPQQPLAENFLDQGGRAYDFLAQPEYPAEYLAQGKEGKVTFLVVVARDGTVAAYQEIESDGPLFAEAAEKALRQMRYRPGTYRGQAVRFSFYETFEFKLQ
ncbi:MAG: TonB family protein [Calditrichaeota bacterium]|nr:TonB family protein [Calditrichota bacterium]